MTTGATKKKTLAAGLSGLNRSGPVDIFTQKTEFSYLPIDSIIVEPQIRSRIDKDSEAFKEFVTSIRSHGVLEPVIVHQSDRGYVLIAGERRYVACQILELETIPARILDKELQAGEIINLQLVENLQREGLNPIDEANAYHRFCVTSIREMSVKESINLFTTWERDDTNRIDIHTHKTLADLQNTAAKSVKTIRRLLSLLLLSDEIQGAIAAGTVPVTFGYILAQHADDPRLDVIFKKIIEGKAKLTAESLEALFANENRRPKPKAEPARVYGKKITSVQKSLEKDIKKMSDEDIESVWASIEALYKYIKGQRKKV
ncbi:MAG: Nucleoid occlusion protein [Syntrophus sp. SKADARSKE-3]|nr:Nucleoid occlusion protein [Syntrophus sp. SKADARSKE-3]